MMPIPRFGMPRPSKIIEFWRSTIDPSGWEPAGFDAEMSIPSCMICGIVPAIIRKMLDEPETKADLEWDRSRLERSHLHSHALGGSSDASNLIMACRPCNRMMPQMGSRVDALRFLLEASWPSRRFCDWAMTYSTWKRGGCTELIEALKICRSEWIETRDAEQNGVA
jgi:hypothetical protein